MSTFLGKANVGIVLKAHSLHMLKTRANMRHGAHTTKHGGEASQEEVNF
jgi:hypothetical protein